VSTVIEMRRVVKRYPGSGEVLRGVDLTVGTGELLAIVGPSGSGKSTLLHVMGTLERPDGGSVAIAGHEVSGLSDAELSAVRARAIGFVFQQFFLLDGMSALENVANGLLYSGCQAAERRRLAIETLTRVGLAERLHHQPAKLSGGERQRVAIARAVVGRPEVVLADEPTGNLDSHAGAGILRLLRELNDEGATIVVITHNADLAASLGRQVEVRDGLVVRDTGAA